MSVFVLGLRILRKSAASVLFLVFNLQEFSVSMYQTHHCFRQNVYCFSICTYNIQRFHARYEDHSKPQSSTSNLVSTASKVITVNLQELCVKYCKYSTTPLIFYLLISVLFRLLFYMHKKL